MSNKIYIFDAIFEYGFNDKKLAEKLDSISDGEQITIYINSPGGSVFTGYSIYNLIQEKTKTNEVIVKITGIAASIATIIASAGTKTLIAKTASYLIHNPWSVAIGDAEEFKKQGKTLDEITNQLVEVYQRRTNLKIDRLKDLMNEDRPITSNVALKYKLVDGIYEPDKDEEVDVDASNYKQMLTNYYKYVAISNRNKNLTNNKGEESMPDNQDSNTNFGKLYNEKVEELTNLKITLNQKDTEILNLKNEIADQKVKHNKELQDQKTINDNLIKENQKLNEANAKIEVETLVNKLVAEGKILPATKDYESYDLLDKKLNNEEAFNKKVELLNSLPKNKILESNYDRKTDNPDKFTVKDLEDPDLNKEIDKKAELLSKKLNVSYEDALDIILTEEE